MPRSPNSLMMSAMLLPCAHSQQVADQPGLTGAEEAGDDGGRNLAHGLGGHQVSLLTSTFIGSPATTNTATSAFLRQALMQDAGKIAEAPRQRIVRHDPKPGLVRDKDHPVRRTARRMRSTRRSPFRHPCLAQQIAELEGQAIDQDHAAPCSVSAFQGVREGPAAPRPFFQSESRRAR